MNFVHYISGLIEPFSHTPLFYTFCRQHQKKAKEKHRERELTRLAVQKFDELMRTREPAPDSYCGTQKLMKNIKPAKKKSDKEFSFLMEKIEEEVAKNIIQIYQLSPSKDEQRRLTIGENDLDVSKLEWLKVGELDTLSSIVVHSVYTVDSIKVLVILNEETRSKANVYNSADLDKAVMSTPLGKIVSESSFNSTGRVLAIQFCMNFGVIHFLRFGEDYLSARKFNELDLGILFGLDNDSFPFCLQPYSNFLWVFSDDRLRKMDYKKSILVETVNIEVGQMDLALNSTPDGKYLLATERSGRSFPVNTETGNVLDQLDLKTSEVHFFTVGSQLLLCQNDIEGRVHISTGETVPAQSETKVVEIGNESEEIHNKSQHTFPSTYIEWMFKMFPFNDKFSAQNQKTNFWFLDLTKDIKIQQSMTADVETVVAQLKRKQPSIMDSLIFHTNVSLKSLQDLSTFLINPLPLGNFMKTLVTAIPIQIARYRDGKLQVLNYNKPVAPDLNETVFEFAEKINFGFYESVLNSWKGSIKVVSSIGKSSTGKSCLLNHLTNSSFQVSRTEGCWMAIKEHDDCLFVILDFEGLGNFERSEQEDAMMCLFSSSISSLTIFKTSNSLDRSIVNTLNRASKQSKVLKNEGHQFRSKLAFVVSIVDDLFLPENIKDFKDNIEAIASRGECNFVQNLFSGDFDLATLSAFDSKEYYDDITKLRQIILSDVSPLFTENATLFLRTLKLILASLAIKNFNKTD